MRVDDRVPPAVSGDRPGPDVPMGQWPAQLFVAVERVAVDLPTWDDFVAVWDGVDVWDAPAGADVDYVDAVCAMHGLSIETGTPDPEGRFTAGEAHLTLDNRDGAWSQYDTAGRLVDWLPGRELLVWAVLDGVPWWLFAGHIARWNERADGTVEVDAFDLFSRANAHIGNWTPGTAGDHPDARFAAIVDLFGYDGPTRFDRGEVTLSTAETDETPLEVMQRTAISDGGIIGVDADGTLTYRDRTWPGGRPDQVDIPTVSDNVCSADAIVWDLELATDDLTMMNVVDLENVDGIRVHAENVNSRTLYGILTPSDSRTDDLWQTAAQGSLLAEFLVTRRGDAYVRVEELTLYVHDPQQDLWRVALDRRLGDVIELLHAQPVTGGEQILDLFLAVQAIAHDITPDGWVARWSTTRTVGNRVLERWDQSLYGWDQDHEQNVWGA